MTLTPEQKQTVATWVAAGDNLSVIQKKLVEQFKVSLTYRDVRFLVDDLGLELKDPAPKADASDVSKSAPARPAPRPAAGPGEADEDSGPGPGDDELPEDAAEGAPGAPEGLGGVTLELDRIMRPGTAVSGTVTFSDGISGKWALDHQGRLMLETAQSGYKPSAPDIQSFQRELQTQLQRQGY